MKVPVDPLFLFLRVECSRFLVRMGVGGGLGFGGSPLFCFQGQTTNLIPGCRSRWCRSVCKLCLRIERRVERRPAEEALEGLELGVHL